MTITVEDTDLGTTRQAWCVCLEGVSGRWGIEGGMDLVVGLTDTDDPQNSNEYPSENCKLGRSTVSAA